MASRGRGARQKGFQFERDVAAAFSEATGFEFKRGLGQTRGGGSEVPDVLPPPGILRLAFHIECKRQKVCSIKGAMKQAVNDIGDGSQMPIVVTKDDRKDTLVTMQMSDFLKLFSLFAQMLQAPSDGPTISFSARSFGADDEQ
jgi:Holliday junction resolvase